MKKNVLLISILILSMIFSFTFRPLTVKADETNEVNETFNEEQEEEGIKEEKEDLDEKPTEGKGELGETEGETPTKGEEEVPPTKGEETEGETPTTQEGEPEAKDETPTTSDTETKTEAGQGGQVYDITKVKVTISKVDEEGNPLKGAVLQLYKDKVEGEPLAEWTSDGTDYIIELTDGKYIVHEKSAPDGYDLAADEEFNIKVEIQEISAGSDASATPCAHYTGTQMYYVKIKGIKQETYCINQGWNTPDNESIYDGQILSPNDIKEYTKQTVPVNVDPSVKDSNGKPGYGIIYTDGPVDISDPTLNSKELYDKILDIIYHGQSFSGKIVEKDDNGNDVTYEYSVEEIRFLTEVALKNYTNALLTERQYNVTATNALIEAMTQAGVTFKTYDENGTTKIAYIKHNYRDYVYTPNVPMGSDIAKVDYGKGDSFGQMVANHWNFNNSQQYLHPDAVPGQTNHNARGNQTDRDTVARYYKLYQLLISSENPHPTGMNLYIYSSKTTPSDPDSPDNKYQNLLGVTGYFEQVEQQKKDVKITNNYSTEKTSATVKKVWDDNNNQDGKRPESITVKLSNGETVTLNEKNNWEATIENLPKYNKNQLIKYTWEEVKLPEGYKLTSVNVEGLITTITNSYTPEVRNIKVNKIWHDDNNQYHVRAKEVTVNILADDEVIKTITLNEDNGWAATLEKLPVYQNGKKIEYKVSEFEVEYYKIIIEENEEGFTINNFYDAKGGEEPPKTSDNIYGSIIALIISVTGIGTCIYLRKRYN